MQHITTPLSLLLALTVTACAADAPPNDDTTPDDNTPNTCGSSGGASISGTVAGASISNVARAAKIKVEDGFVVLSLDEAPGMVCGDPGPTGEHLVFGFCSEPGVGTHAIKSSESFACPGGSFALIERDEGEDVAEATGGSITISSSDASCTSGSFSLDFGAEKLTGTFDAVACP